mgnify:CR=1 FL=1
MNFFLRYLVSLVTFISVTLLGHFSMAGQISVINPSAGSAYIDTTPIVVPSENGSTFRDTGHASSISSNMSKLTAVVKVFERTNIDDFSLDQLGRLLNLIDVGIDTRTLTSEIEAVLQKEKVRLEKAIKTRN